VHQRQAVLDRRSLTRGDGVILRPLGDVIVWARVSGSAGQCAVDGSSAVGATGVPGASGASGAVGPTSGSGTGQSFEFPAGGLSVHDGVDPSAHDGVGCNSGGESRVIFG
jgi:hypothetical protein